MIKKPITIPMNIPILMALSRRTPENHQKQQQIIYE